MLRTDLPPKRTDYEALVGRAPLAGWIERRADDHRDPRRRNAVDAHLVQQRGDVGQRLRRSPATKQVVEREQRVRLPTAKGGFQLNYGFATPAADAPERGGK